MRESCDLNALKELESTEDLQVSEAIAAYQNWFVTSSLNILFNTCTHCVSKSQVLKAGSKSKNFDSTTEWECPVCSKPANIKLPIFKKDVIKALDSVESAYKIDESFAFDELLSDLRVLSQGKLPPNIWHNQALSEEQIYLLNSEVSEGSNALNMVNIWFSIALEKLSIDSEKDPLHMQLKIASSSLGSLLSYLLISDLKSMAKQFGKVYSSILALTRLPLVTFLINSDSDKCPESMKEASLDLFHILVQATISDISALYDFMAAALAASVSYRYRDPLHCALACVVRRMATRGSIFRCCGRRQAIL